MEQKDNLCMSDEKGEKNNLDIIVKMYQMFLDGSFVFKRCRDFIVVMKKLETTQTNEDRFGIIDPLFAKFRADKLLVVKIISITDPSKLILSIDHKTNYGSKTIIRYECNATVVPDKFDTNLEIVCTNGIHYFKTIEPAYYYDISLKDYTGIVKLWNDNGQILCDGYMLYGAKDGHWKEWYDTGPADTKTHLEYEGAYLNDEKTGMWKRWYRNGNLMYAGEYLADKRIHRWTKWYHSGNLELEGSYLDDKRTGHWKEWFDDGHTFSEGNYIDDAKIGCWRTWANVLIAEFEYLDAVQINQAIKL